MANELLVRHHYKRLDADLNHVPLARLNFRLVDGWLFIGAWIIIQPGGFRSLPYQISMRPAPFDHSFRQKLELFITKNSLISSFHSCILNHLQRFLNSFACFIREYFSVGQIAAKDIDRFHVCGIPIHPSVAMRLIAQIADGANQLPLQTLGFAAQWYELLTPNVQIVPPGLALKELFEPAEHT
ncbi:MAG: hypothetical protein AB1813_06630 [Verrucomicrobiota bacterium]